MILGSVGMVYFLAAVLPALVLMRYIYRKDTVEKEPAGLLVRCVVSGVFSALLAMVLEEIGESVLSRLISPDSRLFILLLAFLVVAGAEECAKFLFLKRATWRTPHFNYRFDGVVYAVFVSLGFAAFENVGYVMGYGLSVAPLRAVLSIPAHMSFAVFMGLYYGRARRMANRGDRGAAARLNRRGVLMAMFLHGFYDTCAMLGTVLSTAVFAVFVILLDIAVIRTVRDEAVTDEPI